MIIANMKESFKNLFIQSGKGGCWLWQGSKWYGGYGQFSCDGETTGAHRASWEIHNGSIPENMCVLHKCDVRDCVNPDHLFLGTYLDNNRDRDKKGRGYSGDRHLWTKISKQDVLNIRKYFKGERGELQKISKQYGVTASAIRHIVKRRSWKHV